MIETTTGPFDVRRFGAVADGSTVNTAALQAAIDGCHAAGGGTVVLKGGKYLTGTIFLKDNVVLRIEADSTLLGSPRIGDYRESRYPVAWAKHIVHLTRNSFGLICADEANAIGIEGAGAIDGQGGSSFPNADDPQGRRPYLVLFTRCTNIKVRDVTLRNPGIFAFFFRRCRDVWVDSVTVDSRADHQRRRHRLRRRPQRVHLQLPVEHG